MKVTNENPICSVPSLRTDNTGKLIQENAVTPEKQMNNARANLKRGMSVVQSFINEFDASFATPHLTSTPENCNQSSPNKIAAAEKNFAVRRLEISSIPSIMPVVKQCYVSDMEFLPPENIDTDAHEINLFESPVKPVKKNIAKKKACQKIQTKLHFTDLKNTLPEASRKDKLSHFEENARSMSPIHSDVDPESSELPKQLQHKNTDHQRQRIKRACVVSKELDTETEITDEGDLDTDGIFLFDSPDICAVNKKKRKAQRFDEEEGMSPVKFLEVLKPRKSYHSPAQVKRFFARTNKAECAAKDKFTAKDEKLIQSMNEHFSELDSSELCIE